MVNGTLSRRCFSICNNYWSLQGAKQAAQFPFSTTPPPLTCSSSAHFIIASSSFCFSCHQQLLHILWHTLRRLAGTNHAAANAFEIITINIIDMQNCHKMSGNIYYTPAHEFKLIFAFAYYYYLRTLVIPHFFAFASFALVAVYTTTGTVIIVNWFAAATVILWTILIDAMGVVQWPKDYYNKFQIEIARMHFVNAPNRVLNFTPFV